MGDGSNSKHVLDSDSDSDDDTSIQPSPISKFLICRTLFRAGQASLLKGNIYVTMVVGFLSGRTGAAWHFVAAALLLFHWLPFFHFFLDGGLLMCACYVLLIMGTTTHSVSIVACQSVSFAFRYLRTGNMSAAHYMTLINACSIVVLHTFSFISVLMTCGLLAHSVGTETCRYGRRLRLKKKDAS